MKYMALLSGNFYSNFSKYSNFLAGTCNINILTDRLNRTYS